MQTEIEKTLCKQIKALQTKVEGWKAQDAEGNRLLAKERAKIEELTVEKENICTNLTNEALRLVDVCDERQATITEQADYITKEKALTARYFRELEGLRADKINMQATITELEGYLNLMEKNSFHHNKPYMVCVPKEIWNRVFRATRNRPRSTIRAMSEQEGK